MVATRPLDDRETNLATEVESEFLITSREARETVVVSIGSLNVTVIFGHLPTPVALATGTVDETVGPVESAPVPVVNAVVLAVTDLAFERSWIPVVVMNWYAVLAVRALVELNLA